MDEKLSEFREWLCDEWQDATPVIQRRIHDIIDEFEERFGA